CNKLLMRKNSLTMEKALRMWRNYSRSHGQRYMQRSEHRHTERGIRPTIRKPTVRAKKRGYQALSTRKRKGVKMAGEKDPVTGREVAVVGERHPPPAIVTAAGKAAGFAFAEFFGAEIESPHTYRAYRRAVDRFLEWCAERGVTLTQVSPVVVGEYIRKQLVGAKPTKKLHLSALRRFFDQL